MASATVAHIPIPTHTTAVLPQAITLRDQVDEVATHTQQPTLATARVQTTVVVPTIPHTKDTLNLATIKVLHKTTTKPLHLTRHPKEELATMEEQQTTA